MSTNGSKSKKAGTKKISRPEDLIIRCSVVRDPVDSRDWLVAAGHPSMEDDDVEVPEKMDYSKDTPLVQDQGEYGSCVGWAAARGLREWMYWKQTGKKVSLSVRFVWMAAKESDRFEINSFVANAGTSLKAAFKIMSKYGVPEEKYYPYGQDLVAFTSLRDKRRFFYNASKYRIFNYYQLTSNETRRTHLAHIGPFVATVPIDAGWLSTGTDGLIPDEETGAEYGGHAILVVGYDDQKQLFKFKNSWGKAWGKKGFGYFSYKYAEDRMWVAMGTDLVPESG